MYALRSLFHYEECSRGRPVVCRSEKDTVYKDILKYIDVLVDGRFILKEKDLSYLFRGSRNQRLIDIPNTLKENKVILFNESEYLEENKYKKPNTYI